MSKQIAVRLPDELVEFVDELVGAGTEPSRAAVVARALERERRRAIAARDPQRRDPRRVRSRLRASAARARVGVVATPHTAATSRSGHPCRVRGVHDDWRLQVTLAGSAHAEALSGRLEARELSEQVTRELGDAVVVSRDESDVFLYADTHAALRAAEQIVREDLARGGWSAEIVASRWHDDAEDWEPADAPAATSAAQRETEHARLMQREDAESAAAGFPEFEARATLPTRHAARDLSEHLTREGVPNVRRWRHVIVGADDEDAARAWADRLRAESPAGTEVRTEGTFAYVERSAPTPFKGIAMLGGGMP
jgi:Arc/MetJ-type ribon-helix-helix transcriptional regulator